MAWFLLGLLSCHTQTLPSEESKGYEVNPVDPENPFLNSCGQIIRKEWVDGVLTRPPWWPGTK